MSAMTDYKVADISLAEWGKKEIEMAEVEMPIDGNSRGIW